MSQQYYRKVISRARLRGRVLLGAALLWSSLLAACFGSVPGDTVRVSQSSSGREGNAESRDAVSSVSGQFVAFASRADNLVENDTNGTWDIFVRDRSLATTARVSVSTAGAQANGPAVGSSICAQGRLVAFASPASNLVADDFNGAWDIFVHDRQTGVTQRVSLSTGGREANGGSFAPSLSADGRFVAFESAATNLVSDDTNGTWDIFVYDRATGTTHRISVGQDGVNANGASFAPSMSGDGNVVAFESAADNLVPWDTAGHTDVFAYDRSTNRMDRVSVGAGGTEANGDTLGASISADGRYVAFESLATNFAARDTNDTWDVFLHDRSHGTTERVSVDDSYAEGNADSTTASVSGSGRYVAFESRASNLVPDDTNGRSDVFVRDVVQGITRASVHPTTGAEANHDSLDPFLSADGKIVGFESLASNLADSDLNGTWDAFVMANPAAAGDTDGPMAEAGPDQVVECTGAGGTEVQLDGSGSQPAAGVAIVDYTWSENGITIATGVSATVMLDVGAHAIVLVVTDSTGAIDEDVVVIDVADTIAPALSLTVTPPVLWPPNHKMIEVTPVVLADDGCDAAVDTRLENITIDESGETRHFTPGEGDGSGAGQTTGDIHVTEDGRIFLRAERASPKDGRVYTLTYSATDAAGNSTTATATVTVPREKNDNTNKGKK